MRDQGVILLFTSHTQLLSSENQSSLTATGKRNRLAHFRVHKIASGIRTFESVLFPQQFIRLEEGACDIVVVMHELHSHRRAVDWLYKVLCNKL